MIALTCHNGRLLLGLVILLLTWLVLNGPPGSVGTVRAAPSAAGYEIGWWTVDGGGAQNAVTGTYTLSGTGGQYDADSTRAGTYTVEGGYWIDLFGFRLHLPLVERAP